MSCIRSIYSVSAMVGTGQCNGGCKFCAGQYLRKQFFNASLYYKNLASAIKLSARYGGWSLSFTGSGEPTCEPSHLRLALETYDRCAKQGAYFPNVNLFTNGILFGNLDFCREHLPRWRELGLTNVAVSVHDVDVAKQAAAYSVPHYPSFHDIFENVKSFGVGVRATLLLRRGGIDTAEKYEYAVRTLIADGVNNITSWPIGTPDGSRNGWTPSRWNLFGIRRWLRKNAKFCHGHVWGGGVYDFQGNMLRYTDYVTKHNPKNDFVRQLVVFQDGTVAYSWVREGALCMK